MNLTQLWDAFQDSLVAGNDSTKAYALMQVTRGFDRVVQSFYQAYGRHYVLPAPIERILTVFFLRLERAREELTPRVNTAALVDAARRLLLEPQPRGLFASVVSYLNLDNRAEVYAETAAWLGDPEAKRLLDQIVPSRGFSATFAGLRIFLGRL